MQALAEFTYADTIKVPGKMNNVEAAKVAEAQREKNSILTKRDAKQWALYIDDAFNNTESKAGIMLISPEGHKIHCALCYGFKTLNNEAEHKAIIAGLHQIH